MFTREVELVPGWNHPCLWWNISYSYCLHLFANMRFHPGMNSSMSKRQRWNFTLGWKKEKKTSKRFIPGWSFKMIVFFNFWCMNSNIMGTAFFPLGGQRDHTRKKMYIFHYELLRHWRDWNWTRKQNHLILTQRLNHLAKLSGRLAILRVQVFEYSFRWFWVRVQLQSLHLQISRLLRARSSLTFKQL